VKTAAATSPTVGQVPLIIECNRDITTVRGGPPVGKAFVTPWQFLLVLPVPLLFLCCKIRERR
jgi:hypothetical protein